MILFDSTAQGFTPENALYLALASELAYFSENVVERHIPRLLGTSRSQTRFFRHGRLHGFITADAHKALIVFGGENPPSHPGDLRGWIDGFSTAPLSLASVFDQRRGVPFRAKIHRTYGLLSRSLMPRIAKHLNEILPSRRIPIYLAGHGIGGALALSTAIFFTWHQDYRRPFRGLYTFGQPKVTNPALTRACNRAFKNRYFRVINHLDIIPRLPQRRLLGLLDAYGEPGTAFWFNQMGVLHHGGPPSYRNVLKDSSAVALDSAVSTTRQRPRDPLLNSVWDHPLRETLFSLRTNPESYLCKLALLAGVPLPPRL